MPSSEVPREAVVAALFLCCGCVSVREGIKIGSRSTDERKKCPKISSICDGCLNRAGTNTTDPATEPLTQQE